MLTLGCSPATPPFVVRIAELVPGIACINAPDDAVLLADPNVDLMWIGPPVPTHADRALAAIDAGKHVIVEKPMALSLERATEMIDAAQRKNVLLLGGHSSYSYQLPVRVMRRIVQSGRVGKPRAVLIWSATDWMLRPRADAQSKMEHGAGLLHRQIPHQIETLRLLATSPLQSVRASIDGWASGTDEPAFYTALLTFADGMSATIMHNGHGYFCTVELFPEAAAYHALSETDRLALRDAMRAGAKPPFERKIAATSPDQPWSPVDLGMLVLSCERGDLRHAPYGVEIIDDSGREIVDLRLLMKERLLGETDLGGGAIIEALREMNDAVCGTSALLHDGAWGLGTLEATLCIIESAKVHRDVSLFHQTHIPQAYDDNLVYLNKARLQQQQKVYV